MSADPNPLKSPVAMLAAIEHDALPAGTRFGEFEIIRVLGVGGFGIVYLAQDHSLERQVALKEYMPSLLAARGSGPTVTIRAGQFASTYAMGLRSFINEARLLARFDHPSLVKVYRFWEDNGTAYMVMPYLEGRTLRDARRALGAAPDEVWIRAVLEPLLDALELLHGEGVYHRDIAPDNILLPPEGLPILLDFGAARRVIADRTQSLTAIIKPSYAPIEQYAEMTAMRQGPWTDIYALGAVLHYLLFGVPPAPAVARAVQPEIDEGERIEQRVVPGVTPRFVSAVAWMLQVRPAQRPQSVASLRAVLGGQMPIPSNAQGDVTVPGDTALMCLASQPLPFAATRVDTAHQPTVAITTRAARVSTESSVAASKGSSPEARTGALIATRTGASSATSRGAFAAAHTAVSGAAPMRSSPPGTLPPPYVPPRRAKRPVAADGPSSADPARAAQPPRAPQRGPMIAGVIAAAVIAAGVLWQFVGSIGGQRTIGDPPLAVASAAPPISSAIAPAISSGITPAISSGIAPPVSPKAVGASLDAAPVTAAAVGPTSAETAAARPNEVGFEAKPAAASHPTNRLHAGSLRVTSASTTKRAESSLVVAGNSPREVCTDRGFLASAICIDRACARPRFHDAPECTRIREEKRRREER